MSKFTNTQEEYFYYWLEELEKEGYVKNITYNSNSFNLNDSLSVNYKKITGKKTEIKELKLIKERSYTPDFIFEFTEKAKGIFYFEENEDKKIFPLISKDKKIYVDTKGEYTKHYSSTITFGDRQAMMWYKHQIYVQIIKPFIKDGKKCLFEQTFVPSKVLKKEKYLKDIPNKNIKKGDSKIKFDVKTLNEFISQK